MTAAELPADIATWTIARKEAVVRVLATETLAEHPEGKLLSNGNAMPIMLSYHAVTDARAIDLNQDTPETRHLKQLVAMIEQAVPLDLMPVMMPNHIWECNLLITQR